MNYIEKFEKAGFGMMVHFGLYSIAGKGEWYQNQHGISKEAYETYFHKFKVNKNWADNLVRLAEKSGCRYITLTTRHHDGFSLYDTKGLSDFDCMGTPTARDLIKEFVDACNKKNILPIFYHALLDWHNPDYENDFPSYMDYLIKSVETLCTGYGKIGGFWFDGMWDKPDEDWQEDRLYGTIRKYQPEALIINNTGLSERGKVGHKELDSVTFERGKPAYVDQSDKHRTGEMCQVMNDHWGYAKDDINYKSVRSLIEDLIDCRYHGCNFLLNVGLKGNGAVRGIDKELFSQVGKWIKRNDGFIYEIKPCGIKAENALIVKDDKYFYAIMKDVGMSTDVNVGLKNVDKKVRIYTDKKVKHAVWLDNKKSVEVKDGIFRIEPFEYGTSLGARVLRFEL